MRETRPGRRRTSGTSTFGTPLVCVADANVRSRPPDDCAATLGWLVRYCGVAATLSACLSDKGPWDMPREVVMPAEEAAARMVRRYRVQRGAFSAVASGVCAVPGWRIIAHRRAAGGARRLGCRYGCRRKDKDFGRFSDHPRHVSATRGQDDDALVGTPHRSIGPQQIDGLEQSVADDVLRPAEVSAGDRCDHGLERIVRRARYGCRLQRARGRLVLSIDRHGVPRLPTSRNVQRRRVCKPPQHTLSAGFVAQPRQAGSAGTQDRFRSLAQ